MAEEAGTAVTSVSVTEASKQGGLEGKKKYPWFMEEVGEIAEPMRKLLEEYSGIPSDKVKSHVQEIVSISCSNLSSIRLLVTDRG
jgi:hypothetical protein